MKTEIKNIANEMQTTSMVARDWVFQVIRAAIVRGVLPCNMPLRQDEISEALNISHIPVREAFRQLEAYGLVKIYPNRGAVVSALDEKEILDMTNVLSLLEASAVENAIESVSHKQAESVKAAADSLHLEHEANGIASLNMNFHIALCEPSQNHTLLLYVEQLHASLDRYLIRSDDLENGTENSLIEKEHSLIADAYLKKDMTAIRELLKTHFEHERQLMLNSPLLKNI